MSCFARRGGRPAVGSAASTAMRRAIASFRFSATPATVLVTAVAFSSAACAPPALPPQAPSQPAAAAISSPARPAPAHLVLAEAAPEPPPDTAMAPLPPPDEPEKKAQSESHGSEALPRALGWFAISIGAGAGLVAIGTSIMMLHQHDLRNNDCNAAKVCSTDGYNANGQLQALSPWNLGSYIVAAAGLGVGTILVLTNPTNKQKTALEVSPNGSGAGLLLRSTF